MQNSDLVSDIVDYQLIFVEVNTPKGFELKNDNDSSKNGHFLYFATAPFIIFIVVGGKKCWEKEDGPGFYSSPVVSDNKLFTIDTNGKMRVYEVAKEMKLLGESNLGEKVTTTPAFAEGRMYIRTPKFLYCMGKK